MRVGPATFKRLCSGRDMLVEEDEHPLSVRDVARRVGISPFHFIRQFETVFGSTPHQFRIGTRIDRAKQMLALGQGSVTEVCMATGFSSLGSFSSSFSRRVGEAPSIYQRRMRVLVQVPAAISSVISPGCFSLMGMLPAAAFRNFEEAPAAPARQASSAHCA